MKYVIYGAGKSAKIAYDFLGPHRVACFATSNNHRLDDYLEKSVLSYSELLSLNPNEYIIVIASEKYCDEMVKNLISDGVSHYFVFHEKDVLAINNFFPKYEIWGHLESKTYTQILSLVNIRKYRSIAIYGSNYALPYLISEIEMQSGIHSVKYILTDDSEVSECDASRRVGVPVYKLEDFPNDIDCLLINCRRDQSTIHEKTEVTHLNFDILDIYDFDECIPEFLHPELEKFHNIHLGQRCFVIGNGPSLKLDDLMTLHSKGEITFAFNRIYKVFDKIAWRPTYYGITDGCIYDDYIEDIDTFECEAKFLADEYHRSCNKIKSANYIHYNIREYYPNHPRFSTDITKGIFWGRTVVYELGLQLAIYMGFKEIFLIGVDHNYSPNIADKSNHFIECYFDEEKKKNYEKMSYEQYKVELAYEKAKMYAEEHGIKIYNSTRGGALEVFERIEFEKIFEG